MPAVGSGRSAQRSRSLVAAAGLDAEQLLLDDVGDRAHAPLEDLGLLEQRRLDGLVAVARGEVARRAASSRRNAARSAGSRSRVPRGAWYGASARSLPTTCGRVKWPRPPPSTFSRLQPEALQFLVDLAGNNERAWFQPRKPSTSAAQGAPRGAVRGPRRTRSSTRHCRCSADPKKLALPHLPRHALPQGQVALQDARRGELPVGRGGRDGRAVACGTVAATSTSRRARRTSAAACGIPSRPASPRSGRMVDTSPKVHAAIEDPAFLARFERVNGDSLKRVPTGFAADHPRPSCSSSRT